MSREAYYSKMFTIGAIWNMAATAILVAGYPFLFPRLDMDLPRYPVFFLLFLGVCFLFGIGYYWVGRDLGANHAIVWLGIVGKVMVFAGLAWAGLTGQINPVLVIPGVVDLVFAVLFGEFLKTFHENVRATDRTGLRSDEALT